MTWQLHWSPSSNYVPLRVQIALDRGDHEMHAAILPPMAGLLPSLDQFGEELTQVSLGADNETAFWPVQAQSLFDQ